MLLSRKTRASWIASLFPQQCCVTSHAQIQSVAWKNNHLLLPMHLWVYMCHLCLILLLGPAGWSGYDARMVAEKQKSKSASTATQAHFKPLSTSWLWTSHWPKQVTGLHPESKVREINNKYDNDERHGHRERWCIRSLSDTPLSLLKHRRMSLSCLSS